MTLNGQKALWCRKYASFGAQCTKLNEDRPIHAATKMRFASYVPIIPCSLLEFRGEVNRHEITVMGLSSRDEPIIAAESFGDGPP